MLACRAGPREIGHAYGQDWRRRVIEPTVAVDLLPDSG